jgi:hypothetical protein
MLEYGERIIKENEDGYPFYVYRVHPLVAFYLSTKPMKFTEEKVENILKIAKEHKLTVLYAVDDELKIGKKYDPILKKLGASIILLNSYTIWAKIHPCCIEVHPRAGKILEELSEKLYRVNIHDIDWTIRGVPYIRTRH